MRFTCDRCKTRYSIADERVRGKILKIRCKNCAEVITVRGERPGQDGAEAFGAAGQPAWFLAVGGIQHGPMSLTDAMAWVAKREPTELIYGWSEGLDGWRSVDEIDHFADLREPPPPGEEPNFEGDTVIAPPTYGEDQVLGPKDPGDGQGEGAAKPPEAEEGPLPGAASEPQAAPELEPTSEAEPASPRQQPAVAAGGLAEFDAGVTIPSLDAGEADLRIGRGRSAMPFVLIALLLAAAAGGYYVLTGGDEPSAAAVVADAAPPIVELDAAPPGPRVVLEPLEPIEAAGEGGEVAGDAGVGPRSSAEFPAIYDEHEFLITRCFTRALDDEPDLDLELAELTIEIAPAGRVAEVSLSELDDPELGACIESRIRGWQLREATEAFEATYRLRFIR
jgi:predicted Zn finger-like uncharacterized protein